MTEKLEVDESDFKRVNLCGGCQVWGYPPVFKHFVNGAYYETKVCVDCERTAKEIIEMHGTLEANEDDQI